MVATVLRLRYRILGNTLLRNPWQLVGFCFGMLGALWILVLAVGGLVALATLGGLELARAVTVVGGSVLLLGWVLGPVLVAGMETTVDAVRLAPFPIGTRPTMLALVAVGLTGVPGIVTGLVALATVVVWVRWPFAAVVAVPCAVIAVLTCVVASRLVATVSGDRGRRGQEIVGTLLLVAVTMIGPIMLGVMALLGQAADLASRFSGIAAILGWTPLGAAWAVPGEVAAGAWLAALAKLAIAVATLIALWLVWAWALRASVAAPSHRAARTVRSGALGLFGRMPTGGVGATWARSLTAWLRDPRYLRQLVVVPLLPIVFAFTGGLDGPLFWTSALLVAFILAFAGYTDVSYDGTAFATVLATGIRGRDDRLGRLLGAACVGVPLVVVVAIVTVLLAGEPGRLPAVLGGALGIVLVGYGVTAVSSALIVTPVAAPGDSPFKSVPGQTFVTGLSVFVVWGICAGVALPAIVLSVVAFVTASPLLGWIALAVGLAWGVGAIVAGVVLGGRVLDRTAPDLLARIKAFPTT